jgi:REP-associated tyrosine transposase
MLLNPACCVSTSTVANCPTISQISKPSSSPSLPTAVWILPEPVRQIVIDTCLAGNGRKFRLYAVVVMPDHVHMVLVPKCDADGPIGIAEIMQAIKGASAHRINKALGRKGKVWESESFDRLRQEESIGDKVDYILGNPVGEGLVHNPLEYRWLWRDTGGTDAA